MRNESSESNEAKTREVEDRPRDASARESEAARSRASNRRIAWTLFALSTVFFVGIILSRLSGDTRIGLIVLGAAITLFLVVAIGRNLRK